jgi:hypothetical protein
MKKILKYFFALLIAFLFMFKQVSAVNLSTIKFNHTTQFDALAGTINFGAFVCNEAPCNISSESNWYNYSSNTVYSEGERGEKATLTAHPGDTLTFLTEIKYSASYDAYSIHPTFDINFSGANYLENITYFDGQNNDLDNDGIDYSFNENQDIVLSSVIHNSDPAQLGAITAKIKSDTPNNTIIEARLWTDGDQYLSKNNNPFVSVAHAASIAESTVRILVTDSGDTVQNTNSTVSVNASETPTATSAQSLPETGRTISSWHIFLLYLLIIGVIITAYKIISNRIKLQNSSKNIQD